MGAECNGESRGRQPAAGRANQILTHGARSKRGAEHLAARGEIHGRNPAVDSLLVSDSFQTFTIDRTAAKDDV